MKCASAIQTEIQNGTYSIPFVRDMRIKRSEGKLESIHGFQQIKP